MNSRILASAVVIFGFAAVSVGGAMAYFSDTASSTGNTFTAGTVDVRLGGDAWNGNAYFEVEGLAPGDSVTREVAVLNDGSLDMLFRAYVNASGYSHYEEYFSVDVDMITDTTSISDPIVNNYSIYGPGNIDIWSGPLTDLEDKDTTPLNNISAWADTGWPLPSDFAAVYEIEITLDYDTPPKYEGKTLWVDLIVDAVQSANQDKPASTPYYPYKIDW